MAHISTPILYTNNTDIWMITSSMDFIIDFYLEVNIKNIHFITTVRINYNNSS